MEYQKGYHWNIVEFNEISWDTMGIYRLVVEHNYGLAISRCFTHQRLLVSTAMLDYHKWCQKKTGDIVLTRLSFTNKNLFATC